jgi:hypothetical protein
LEGAVSLRRWVAIVGLCGASTACVSTKTVPLDAVASDALSGKTVVLAKRGIADFAIISVKNSLPGALFGPIGGAVAAASAIATGNELVRTNHIADPAEDSGAAILDVLAAKYRLIVRDAGGAQVHGRQSDEIIKAYPGVDLVLDVETVNWTAIYFGGDWSHYGLIYRAKLRLIDARTAKLVAEASCVRKPEKQPDSPTYDQLLQDGAARLKSLSSAASNACRDELRSKLLLSSPLWRAGRAPPLRPDCLAH